MALLLTASLLPLKGSASLQPETVRVAVLKGVDSVRLEGDGFLAADDRGNPLPLSSPLTVKGEKQALSVSGKTLRRLVVSAPSPVSINGKKYRGIIDITPQEKGLLVVDELPLEEYLVGLINCEISSQWPMEAVKAQAVVARTYAVFQKDSRNGSAYHLESSVLDQVYEGCSVEDTRAARGVRETAGEVLTYNGKVIQSFFHSVCGGRTEAVENVWGMELPYLDGVECRYCLDSPSVRWEQTVPLKKLEGLLKAGGVSVPGLKDIRISGKNRSGRVNSLQLTGSQGTVELPAVKFRRLAGFTLIRSTAFNVRIDRDDARFDGRGYGHGVGLCQWGARSRAASGFSYRDIVTYYYPGTLLKRITD